MAHQEKKSIALGEGEEEEETGEEESETGERGELGELDGGVLGEDGAKVEGGAEIEGGAEVEGGAAVEEDAEDEGIVAAGGRRRPGRSGGDVGEKKITMAARSKTADKKEFIRRS